MHELFQTFHWAHAIIFPILAVIHLWAWRRSGFWVPGYVHAIAMVALAVGVVVQMTLPPSTNPNPWVQWSMPLIFPTFFMLATYAIAIFSGCAQLAHREKLKRTTATAIRIIATPPGPAPEDVRAAWIGLVLPVSPGNPKPIESVPEGILANVWSFLMPRHLHYVVPVDDAILILEKASPGASVWWKQNTPESLGSGQVFLFRVDVCEPIS